jgi:hypothetical protein
MSNKGTNDVGTVSTTLLSGLLIIVAAMEAVEPHEVASQNVTDIFTLPSERGTQSQNTIIGGSIRLAKQAHKIRLRWHSII